MKLDVICSQPQDSERALQTWSDPPKIINHFSPEVSPTQITGLATQTLVQADQREQQGKGGKGDRQEAAAGWG